MVNLAKPEVYSNEIFLKRLRHGVSQETQLVFQKKVSQPKKKFVIFAQGRTGSTLLTTLLNSHSQIFCDQEIYYYPRIFPFSYAERLSRRSGSEVYGFKVKIYQVPGMLRRDPKRLLDRLENSGYKIIYLQRRNLVQHAFSSYFAIESKAFHFNKDDDSRKISFRIEPDTFLRLCSRRKMWFERELKLLTGREHLRITYEEDLVQANENWTSLSEKAFGYLDLPIEKLSTPLRKSVQQAPSAYLDNVDEISQALQNSEFSEFADSLYSVTS